MKSQKVTKSSKYTQASPSDVIEYQNIPQTIIPLSPQGTTIINDHQDNKVTYAESVFYNVNQSSELLLKNAPPLVEHPAPPPRPPSKSKQENVDTLCHCVQNKDVCRQKSRFDIRDDDGPIVLTRSYSSLPRVAAPPRHTYVCEQNQRILREIKTASLRRMQSPEIINIHRGPTGVFYDGYGVEHCAVRPCDIREDYSSLRRGQSVRSTRRSQQQHAKRRPDGDGMDASLEESGIDGEMMLNASERHLQDCQCACDHVVYGPTAYTCLQVAEVIFGDS
ncbi:uncharacterized protein LOC126744162 [Anthonomus grandis grandis]|uniref:uncharacterized protein LOC126744162 n=1 Tax=Anthonomus grandis grandis TaxID=2921223 RepID=UPI00216677BE|nr:uncharacterized protein LOC126744162 [Anthonomus grandis grandis]